MQTITFNQWNTASTEQRQRWLDEKAILAAEDLPLLEALIREQQKQPQEQTPKHTPGRLSVHGCALYEQDNWQNGNNLARKLPVAITYHPEADRVPSETEIANAQEIARRWNAFLDAKTHRAAIAAATGE